jgi:pimeloyl-ACP methyl ester carboxylesterase
VKVIWGEIDRALERELGYAIGAHVDGDFNFHIIKRCGHWVQQEAPEEFNRQLADFLNIK